VKMKLIMVSMIVAASAALLPVAAQAAPAIPTSLLINVDPVAMPVGETAVVTATVTPDTGEINCGKGQIQYRITTAGITGSWQQLANNLPVAANKFSAIFDTTSVLVLAGDSIDFRAGYESSGSGCDYQNDAIGQSPSTTLLIVAAPTTFCPDNQVTGVFVSIKNPQGNGMPLPGQSGPWSFDVDVLACENVFNVSAQGGANGWAPIKSYAASVGSVQGSVKNKNTVYLWTIGSLNQGNHATLTVTVDGTIKNSPNECGKEKQLNGDWSALYATVPGGPLTKSAYTTYKAAIQVTCP
jgi:hypothetical protein